MVLPVPSRPYAQGFRLNLGDDWFRVVASNDAPLRVYTKDSLAERQDQSASSEERILDIGFAFSRSNLTGGEGLDYFPRAGGVESTDLDKSRFWDSSDLEIFRPVAGQPFALRVVHDSETWWTPASTPVDMGTSADRLYVIAGDTVHRFNNMVDTTADDTDDLLASGTLINISVGNDNAVAVLDSAGDIWYKAPSTETYLKVYDSTTDGPILDAKAIWLVKGRIIAYCDDLATAGDGVMLEIGPVITGTPGAPTEGAHTYTTIDTFGCVMLDCVDAGHAIVASFSDGSVRSYVPIADAAGDVPLLTIRGRTQMPVGETPYRLAHNLGTLLIWTVDTDDDHARLYSASVLDDRFDFVVGGLQLLRTWVDSVESSPAYTSNAMSTRDAIYFWMGESAANWNLWRYDLVTTGLFRERGDSRDTQPFGTVDFGDVFVFGVGANVIRTNDDYKTMGYLITPNITFGLNTPINWTSFVVEAENLGDGAQVEILRSSIPTAILDPESFDWVTVQAMINDAQSGVEQTRINVTSNTQALQVRVFATSAQDAAAEVTRFAVRAYPQHRDWIVEAPVNISDYIDAPGRSMIHIPGWGNQVYSALLEQQGASTTLTLLEPPTVLQGVVDNIGTPVNYMTDRGGQGQYCIVFFRGTRLFDVEQSAAFGTEGMGIAPIGITTMGIGEIEP